MPRCLVSLGSNQGDRERILARALEGLRGVAEADSLRVSALADSLPVGGPASQGVFLNAAAVFETDQSPLAVLAHLQRLELAANREREIRWAARTLDLDLLLYGEEVIRTPELRVPHPRMTFRPFVLGPACEVAGEMPHPECLIAPRRRYSLKELWDVLRRESSSVTLVRDEGEEVAEWIRDAHPWLEIASIESTPGTIATARLTIDAISPPGRPALSGPRLVLADCPREHWREEVLAALECVWPKSGEPKSAEDVPS